MDEVTFWALITRCRQESKNDTELVSRLLFRHLRQLGAAEVVEFVAIWERVRSHLYSWPVTDAACLLLGPIEEQDLPCIQDWIISHGRATVDRIAEDPDNLADLAGDAGNARTQSFSEFLTEAHIVVSGTWPLDHDPDGPEDLLGEHLDLGDQTAVQQRFPRLTAFRYEHPELGVPELR